jgi:hypothetical protein
VNLTQKETWRLLSRAFEPGARFRRNPLGQRARLAALYGTQIDGTGTYPFKMKNMVSIFRVPLFERFVPRSIKQSSSARIVFRPDHALTVRPPLFRPASDYNLPASLAPVHKRFSLTAQLSKSGSRPAPSQQFLHGERSSPLMRQAMVGAQRARRFGTEGAFGCASRNAVGTKTHGGDPS